MIMRAEENKFYSFSLIRKQPEKESAYARSNPFTDIPES